MLDTGCWMSVSSPYGKLRGESAGLSVRRLLVIIRVGGTFSPPSTCNHKGRRDLRLDASLREVNWMPYVGSAIINGIFTEEEAREITSGLFRK